MNGDMTLDELVPILQIAIGPAIFITGVGLLLSSMNNRIGRIIDRSRVVVQMKRKAEGADRERYVAQLEILWRRAMMMRMAMSQAATGALLAAILVIVLFLDALLGFKNPTPPVALFIGCLAMIILSLINLIRDINLSLHALKIDIED